MGVGPQGEFGHMIFAKNGQEAKLVWSGQLIPQRNLEIVRSIETKKKEHDRRDRTHDCFMNASSVDRTQDLQICD